MRFQNELKERYPARRKRLDELEQFMAEYDARFKRRLTYQASRPRRLVGHNGSQLLLTSLARARFLTATVIHCANGGLTAGMFLAARAHWEMTGLVAHFLITLRRFYAGEMNEAELDKVMIKLAMGRRWEIPSYVKEDVAAINAITLVGSAAKLLGNQKVEKHVKTCYDFLSEFCHPNLLARQTGVTLSWSDKRRVINYDPSFVVAEKELAACVSHGAGSHAIFLYAYDQCFELLNKNEEMPALEG